MRKLVVLLLAVSACSLEPPFDRTNPFDPGSPYPMRLVGVPDTVQAIGQRFQAVIERDPPINTATLAIQWVVTNPNNILAPVSELIHLADGDFISTNVMTAQLRTFAVGAKFNDDVVVGRYITLGQLVDTLNLSCAMLCTAVPLTVGAPLQVFSNARDSRGNEVRVEQFAMQRASVTLRTPGILTSAVTPNNLGTYAFTAAGVGSTWIVIRSDHAVDSVLVNVTP